jgi:hypothetical protein
VQAFVNRRDERLQAFLNDFAGKADSKLNEILDPAAIAPVWVDRSAPARSQIPSDLDADALFRAYTVLRFEEQEAYAQHALRASNSPDSTNARLPLRQMRHILRAVTLVSIAALVVIHVLIVLSRLHVLLPASDWLDVIAIWMALVAIAAKTLIDGFSLDREIDRYKEYLAVVTNLRRLFEESTDNSRKLELMAEMEKAAFEEMRRFLRTQNEAKFVM